MDLAKKRKMDDNGLASSDSCDPNLPLTRDKRRRMRESFHRGEHHSPSFNTVGCVGCTEQPEPLFATSAPTFNGHRYSTPRRYSYDVFLSFRGEDTRHTFIGHLRHALRRTGVNVFVDDDGLRKGDDISPSLMRAIEESRVSVVVLSENYAGSTWCLNELLKIIECSRRDRRVIETVFYGVEPSEVRKQEGAIGAAFEKHERRFSENVKLVDEWRKAMTSVANISGWTLKKNECESTLIQSLVKDVLVNLHRKSLHVADHPVSLQHHVDLIHSSLGGNRVVGLFGMGGVGKTTVAKAVYNLIADQFEGSCFLANVGEIKSGGLTPLQESLLHETLGVNLKIGNVDQGIQTIRNRLGQQKVLLVVDDVDHPDQLRKLVGGPNWFGPGSRIIITTRDEHILIAHSVGCRLKMDCLNNEDALQLFCWNAFEEIHPKIGYKHLSCALINYADGLPLALIVLGSFLRGRSIPEWNSTLEKLKRVPHNEVYRKLKISFDGLEEHEKAIFLDIACFLRGKSKDYIMKILDACGFNSVIGIQILKERSLASIEYGVIQMHDLLQQMGQEIVRQESREPGRCSRLWGKDDVLYVLSNSLGTNAVEGIFIDLPQPEEVHFGENAFANMTSLRLLVMRGAHFSGGPLHLPAGLRWIELPGCSFPSLEFNFGLKILKEVNLRGSNIERLRTGFQNFKDLTSINFADCGRLLEIPDFSTIKNLETLILCGCNALIKVHESVGFLPKLITLNLHSCSNLSSFPAVIKLKSLKTFVLSGCTKLKTFPCVGENMPCLYGLCLERSGIEELPSSIELLVNLKVIFLDGSNIERLRTGFQNFKDLTSINFADCRRLLEIPDFSTIKNLETLILCGCNALIKVHESVGFLPKLITLNLHSCSNLSSFPAVIKLKSLETFVLSGCTKLKTFPCVGENMPCLYGLCLERSGIEELPSSIELLVNLEVIFLDGCKNLTCLPPSLYKLGCLHLLYLSNCSKLAKFPELIEDEDSINFPYCCSSSPELIEDVDSISLPYCYSSSPELIEDVDSISLPYCYSSLRSANLVELVLRNCNLKDVDNLLAPQSFNRLRGLDLSENPFVSLPASIERLHDLDWLCLEHCGQLQEISQLPPNIKHLYVSGCKSLRKFLQLSRVSVSDMKQLRLLELVDFSNCRNMTWFADQPSAEDLRKTSVTINIPGSEIPEWFSHQSSEGTIRFLVPWDRFLNCKSFTFCVVFGLEESITQERGMTDGIIDYNYSITVNGRCIMNDRSDMQCIDSDHLWLFYGSRALRHLVVEHQLPGSVCLTFAVVVNRAPSIVVLKSCGVHLA